MSYASIPGSNDLQYRFQSTPVTIDGVTWIASSLISNFLSNPTSETMWNNMNTLINTFLNTYSQLLPGLRVLVTLSDGTVAYDSSKGSLNTFANYQAGTIGENHNSRVCIMIALLNNSGVANEEKFSTTTGNHENYTAVRMGLSQTKPLGCVRISMITVS
jgi:hypothetical protein